MIRLDPRPLLFLDIDGVLNAHDYDDTAKSCTIRPECVRALNRILDATDARIVLSSAWRYMIHGKAMTLQGFEYMLRTHGVHCVDRLIAFTRKDEDVKGRGLQITRAFCSDAVLRHGYRWERTAAGESVPLFRYLVLDDGGTDPATGAWDDMGIPDAGHPVIWTSGKFGLTEAVADVAIAWLGGEGGAGEAGETVTWESPCPPAGEERGACSPCGGPGGPR